MSFSSNQSDKLPASSTMPAPDEPHRRPSLWAAQARWAPYLFILPFLVVFICFMLYPLGRSLALSFEKTSGAGPSYAVGWENYRFLVKDKLFWFACGNTILFAVL